MSLDVFAGREKRDVAVAYLAGALSSGSVTHAYLLTGAESSGKEDVALRFASGIVADGDEGEFECARRLAHPDVHVCEPDGVRTYSVALVREIVADATLAPIRSARKVYLLPSADALGASAANALLKTLEEPPEDTVLILLAPSESSVLDTIRSRCEHLSLAGGGGRPDSDGEVFAIMRDVAGGCSDRVLLAHAKRLSERAGKGGEAIERERAAEQERNAEFLSAAAARDFEKRTQTMVKAAQNQELGRLLDIAGAWLRECLLVQQGTPGLCAYPDETSHVMDTATSARPDDVLAAIDAVGRCRERVAYNVSPVLALEAMLIEVRRSLAQ